MRYRHLGRTGFEVSRIGLGCGPMMSLPVEDGARLVRRAIELGINYLDVARGYGQSEVMIGRAMQGVRREAVFVSTKTGARTRDEAWRSIQESLQRLQLDYIDNCHLHGIREGEDMDIRMGPGGALEALIEAKDQGLIRHVGCTSHTSRALLRALERYDLDIILVPMNIIERDPLEELVPLCRDRGVAVTIMKPVAVGLLPAWPALKWLLNQPVDTIVPGATTLEELKVDIAVGSLTDLTLSNEEQAHIESLRQQLQHVRCRFCSACDACPQGTPIAQVLGGDVMCGHYRVMGADAFAGTNWAPEFVERDLQAKERLITQIEACNDCGLCEDQCAYDLPVVATLHELLPALRDMVEIYHRQLG